MKLEGKTAVVTGYQLNVTDRKACEEFNEYLKEEVKQVDILVNNAGVTKDALLQKMTDEMWDFVIDVNLNWTNLQY